MAEGVLILQRGGQARGGTRGGHGIAASMAAVIPLSPQLKKVLTVGTHCQGFNLFPFPFYFQ